MLLTPSSSPPPPPLPLLSLSSNPPLSLFYHVLKSLEQKYDSQELDLEPYSN